MTNKDYKKKVMLSEWEQASVDNSNITERSRERKKEELEYTSVIIKRTDEVTKHPEDVLEFAIRVGREQVARTTFSLFLSALSGGLIIGLGVIAVAFASVSSDGLNNDFLQRLSMAIVYPLGFIIVIMGSTQLFTEHTALVIYPFLDKKCSILDVNKVWGVVLSGNLLGALLCSILLFYAEPVIGIKEGYISIAQHLVSFTWLQTCISGVLAGWLMSLGGWLVLSSSSSSSHIVCIYIVTFLIGIGGLHHSIAGSAEVFIAFFMDPGLKVLEVFNFLTAAIIGNLIGGIFFVAILNYAYIKKVAD